MQKISYAENEIIIIKFNSPLAVRKNTSIKKFSIIIQGVLKICPSMKTFRTFKSSSFKLIKCFDCRFPYRGCSVSMSVSRKSEMFLNQEKIQCVCGYHSKIGTVQVKTEKSFLQRRKEFQTPCIFCQNLNVYFDFNQF